MTIFNVGLYPPPTGGVSIHIKRLHEFLIENNISAKVLDVSGIIKSDEGVINIRTRTLIFYLFSKKRIFHFHNFSRKNLIIFYLLSFRHYTVISFHNERFVDDFFSTSKLLTMLTLFLLRKINIIIVTKERCKEKLSYVLKNYTNIYAISPFIPSSTIQTCSNHIILNARKKHKYVIASNASLLNFYKNQDLYGIDLLIGLTDALVHKYNMDIVMLFLLPQINDINYFNLLNTEIKKRKISNVFFFINDPNISGMSVWHICDAVIRATNTDGNSLSVMECLSIGTPVIASDCTERPDGVLLFKNRDISDLTEKTVTLLTDLDYHKRKLQQINKHNGALEIIKIYNRLRLNDHKQN